MQHSLQVGLLLLSLILVSPAPIAAQAIPPVLMAQASGLLRLGDRGDAVVRLQTQLANLGFSPGSIDGVFGAQTEAAVIQFQQSQNLAADGIVGTQTQSALDRLASGLISPIVPPPIDFLPPVAEVPSDTGSSAATPGRGDRFSVLELQRRLQARGFYQGALDGLLGSQTRAAIRAAQRAYGLEADDILNGRF